MFCFPHQGDSGGVGWVVYNLDSDHADHSRERTLEVLAGDDISHCSAMGGRLHHGHVLETNHGASKGHTICLLIM